MGRVMRSRKFLPTEGHEMARITLALCLTVASFSATPALADPVFPDRGRAGVIDAAGVIPDDAERTLNARVVAWDRATGHQLVVATVPSLGGMPIADYGVALGRKWGLGHAGSHFASDGVILLLAPHERKVRIEVGYGLEPVLTDARSGEIIRDLVAPKLKADDIAGALNAGVTAIMATTADAPKVAPAGGSTSNGWVWLLMFVPFGTALGGLLFRIALRRRRKKVEPPATPFTFAAMPSDAGRIPPPPPRRRVDYPSDTYRAAPPSPAPSPSSDFGSSYSPSPSSWPSSDSGSSSSSSDSGSSWGSSDSSSGFDSGGGSFGGGGADSSY